MAEVRFEGVFPILITPFDERGEVDLDSFDGTIRFMHEVGVNGVTILGVLGEANRMVDAEREALIRAAVAAAEGQLEKLEALCGSDCEESEELRQSIAAKKNGG